MDITSILVLVVLGALLVLTFVLPSITNKKNAQKVQDLRSNIKPGDEIMTIGAIIGTVTQVLDLPTGQAVVIETGAGDNKTTMTLDIQGVYKNLTQEAEMIAAANAAAEAAANAAAQDSSEPFADETAEVVEVTEVVEATEVVDADKAE